MTSDIKSIPFLLIEKVMYVHQNGVCAMNNPHGIYNDPGKKASIHCSFHEQSGCPFHEINPAFILKLLSEKFKG